MKTIDLHVHSNVSDGTLTPKEVVALAIESGLSAIALTDHDTTNGVEEAIAYAKELTGDDGSFTVIPGIELSASYKGEDIHILGLYIDYTNLTLNTTLSEVAAERYQRNEKMCANLRMAGIQITMEDLLAGSKDAVITRAHFAKYLLNNGYVSSMKEAFTKYLSPSGPYYVSREYLTPKDAIDLIKNAGGIPILAHPLLYHLSPNQLDALVSSLTSFGLEGIEAIYSQNSGLDESYLRSLARKYNLCVSGGSDFHGSVKPDISIGTGRGNLVVLESVLEDIKKKLTLHR